MILTTIGLTGFGFTIPEIFVLLVKFGVVKTKIIAVFFTNSKFNLIMNYSLNLIAIRFLLLPKNTIKKF
jgi:hypothetical protein